MTVSRVLLSAYLLAALLTTPCGARADSAPAPSNGGPRASAGELAQALALLDARKWQEAQALVAPVLLREPGNPEALWLSGRLVFLLERDAERAAALVDRAIAAAPAESKYHVTSGDLLGARARQAGMLKGMALAGRIKDEYARAVELDPGSVVARTALLRFYLVAPGIAGGSVNRARVQAIEIARLDPGAGAAALAQIEEHEDELDKAAAHLERAVALAKDARARSQHWNSAGYVRLKQKRPDDALACFAKGLAEAPGDANLHDSLGDGHAAKEEWPRAIAAWRRAVELDPALAVSWFSLGQALEKTAEVAGARAAFQRFLALQATGPRAETARARLEALAR